MYSLKSVFRTGNNNPLLRKQMLQGCYMKGLHLSLGLSSPFPGVNITCTGSFMQRWNRYSKYQQNSDFITNFLVLVWKVRYQYFDPCKAIIKVSFFPIQSSQKKMLNTLLVTLFICQLLLHTQCSCSYACECLTDQKQVTDRTGNQY